MRSNKRATKALEEERPAKRRKSQSNDFDLLPDEIIAHILSYSPETIEVCSRFRNVTRSQSFWRSASQNRWGIDLPINNVGNTKWMYNHGQRYVFPFDGKEVDWQAYYSLRSYFCLLLHEVSEWKEMQRDFPIENSELSSENFQHFFNYIQNFDFDLKPFLLKMLPLFISNGRWGFSSLTASYFSSFEFNHHPDLALAKYLLKISQDVEVPELQFEFFKSACVQFYLLQEHNQESKALLKGIVAQLIQYGVEAEVPADVWGRKWEWIYPTVRFKLLNNKSPQLQEMIEYLLDLVIENFHATDDEFHQTSAIGVLQTLIDANNAYVMPARLIHLAVEALRKESQDVRYAGLVLAVVVLQTKQKIDLDNLEAIFVFDKLIEHAQIRRADGYYDIMQPIFKLVSRYPSDLISSQRIQKFITGCVSTMRIERDFFGNVLKHVKYIPKLALIWKERMPDVKKFKLAFASLKCTTTNTGRMYSSCYIRTGYNALGLKFHDEASQFFEEAFKDPINEELYALCGDVLYDAFKQLGQIEEAENVLATLLKLFVPSVTSSTVQLSPNVEKTHKKIQKRYKKLKKRCKEFDQKDAKFINGLFEDEPEDIQQLTLYNSNVKIVKPDKNAVLREVVKHLLHIATDLKSDPTKLGTRAQILSCCLEYHCQGTFYPKGKIDAINELYEDLIPSLSFEQRSFFAKKVHRLVNIGLSRRINTITSGLMHTKEVDATPLLLTALRSMVLNPATHSELCNLIDCLTGAYNDIFPLPVSFVSLIGLIFSLRSTTESTSAFRDSALSNWVVDTMENGTEDMRNDATRVCAILNSSIESRVFEEILIRLKSRLAIKADDLKNTCKRLLESSPPDISTAYMKEFVDATFLIQSRQIQFDD